MLAAHFCRHCRPRPDEGAAGKPAQPDRSGEHRARRSGSSPCSAAWCCCCAASIPPILKRVTFASDWVLLYLLVLQTASGSISRTFMRWGSSWYLHTAVPYLYSLLTFNPQIEYVADFPLVFKLHVAGAFLIVALLPFTKLVHLLFFPFDFLMDPPILYRWRSTRIAFLVVINYGCWKELADAGNRHVEITQESLSQHPGLHGLFRRLDVQRCAGDLSGGQPGVQLGSGEDRLAVGDSGPDRLDFPSAGRDADRQVRRQAGVRDAADSLRHPDVPAFQGRQLYLVRPLQLRLRHGRGKLFHRHRLHLGLVSPRAAGYGAGDLRRRECRGGPDHAVCPDHAQQADQQWRQHRGVARPAGLLRADPGGHGDDFLHLQRQQETGQFRQILHRRC